MAVRPLPRGGCPAPRPLPRGSCWGGGAGAGGGRVPGGPPPPQAEGEAEPVRGAPVVTPPQRLPAVGDEFGEAEEVQLLGGDVEPVSGQGAGEPGGGVPDLLELLPEVGDVVADVRDGRVGGVVGPDPV